MPPYLLAVRSSHWFERPNGTPQLRPALERGPWWPARGGMGRYGSYRSRPGGWALWTFQHVADLAVRDREIALPAGIAGVGLGQALCNREAVAVGLQRRRQIALLHQHVADFLVGDREISNVDLVERI